MDDRVLASLRRLGGLPLDLTTHLNRDVRIEIVMLVDALEDAMRTDEQSLAGLARLRRLLEKLAPTPAQFSDKMQAPRDS